MAKIFNGIMNAVSDKYGNGGKKVATFITGSVATALVVAGKKNPVLLPFGYAAIGATAAFAAQDILERTDKFVKDDPSKSFDDQLSEVMGKVFNTTSDVTKKTEEVVETVLDDIDEILDDTVSTADEVAEDIVETVIDVADAVEEKKDEVSQEIADVIEEKTKEASEKVEEIKESIDKAVKEAKKPVTKKANKKPSKPKAADK